MAAAQLDDLRRMVLAFRITELQVLLGYAGKQKTGKKQELMDRALMLLRNPSYNIVNKVRELHSQRTHRTANGNRPISIPSYNNKPNHDVVQAYDRSKIHEEEIYNRSLSLIRLPFYDHISQILPPTILRQTCFTARYQETMVPFSLSPQHAREITTNRTVGPGGVYTSDVQVQLRFAPVEKQTEDIKDMYPPCLVVRLNAKMIQLPNPIPTNKQNADPKRPPRPLDLTWSCRLTPMVQNTLLISWALPNEPDLPKSYCYTINLVRKRTSEYLTQKVQSRGIRPRAQTESLIKSKLSDEEDDIALTSLKVSLLCPLGKMRMSLPCCPSTCDHIQCFDARLYLMMNEKKPTWNCPVCDSPAKFDDLVIDELFTEICQVAGDCDEILFSPDGSWAPLGQPGKDTKPVVTQNGTIKQSSPVRNISSTAKNQTTTINNEPEKEKRDVDIIVLSDSDDDDCISDNGSSIQPVSRPNKRPISAISSDSSSIDLNSAASSALNRPLSRQSATAADTNRQSGSASSSQPGTSISGPPPSQSFFDPLGSSLAPNTAATSTYNALYESMTRPMSTHNPFSSQTPAYPMFMPTSAPIPNFFSVPSNYPSLAPHQSSSNPGNIFSQAEQNIGNCNNYRSNNTSSSSLSQNSPQCFNTPQIPEPTIIDFSQPRYDDSPLLDDSDIIPLD